jgi:hypothetical protein
MRIHGHMHLRDLEKIDHTQHCTTEHIIYIYCVCVRALRQTYNNLTSARNPLTTARWLEHLDVAVESCGADVMGYAMRWRKIHCQFIL